MYDYFKLWIEDVDEIRKVINNPLLSFKQQYELNTGDIINYPIKCSWKVFELELKSATRLQITGSIHRYWNDGKNDNDFQLDQVRIAIKQFCKELNINPKLATVRNLEYAVNIRPTIDASEIIRQIICYKNTRPTRPYEGRKDAFPFIEFPQDGYYLKVYDKGRQYKTGNILRIEKKAMTADQLQFAGIKCLNDLGDTTAMELLGMELGHVFQSVVFSDHSINPKNLSKRDSKIYNELINPNRWAEVKGHKTKTISRRENRFKEIVDKQGKQKLSYNLGKLISSKVSQLTTNAECRLSISSYKWERGHLRRCITCGKHLPEDQKMDSRFCSSKYVGEEAAKQCRNKKSDFDRKVKKIYKRGVLFDPLPYFIVNNNKKQTRCHSIKEPQVIRMEGQRELVTGHLYS